MAPLTVDDLLRLRRSTDPLADDAVAALRERPRPGEDVLDRVAVGARHGDLRLQRFLDETRALPPSIDPRATRAGRDAVIRHAPVSFLVLLAGSLVESFAVAEGAEVLVRTGRLQRDTVPRIYETAALVRDLLVPDGDDALAPGSRGWRALLRVRLLHAWVRRFVRRSPHWDPGRFGEPVNQMDMLHTLLVFSCVLADGIETFGGRLSDEEKESWCQLWRGAGFLLGVDPSSLPTSAADERRLHALVKSTYRPGDGSRSLTRAVLDALAGQPPFFLPRPAMYAISRQLVGAELADALSLPRSRRWAAFAASLSGGWSMLDAVARRVPAGRRLGTLGGLAFIEGNRWRILRTMPEADYSFRTA
jgi:hypothetical protein